MGMEPSERLYPMVLRQCSSLYLIRAFIALVAGVTAFQWPDLTFFGLRNVLGVYILFDGITGMSSDFRKANPGHWAVPVTEGVIAIFIGEFMMAFKAGFAGMIGCTVLWTLMKGSIELYGGIIAKGASAFARRTFALGGIFTLILAASLLIDAPADPASFSNRVALYSIAFGLVTAVLAAQIRMESIRASSESSYDDAGNRTGTAA
jgi:uncharacterized membrane protein HdeD (DUF308 family)